MSIYWKFMISLKVSHLYGISHNTVKAGLYGKGDMT